MKSRGEMVSGAIGIQSAGRTASVVRDQKKEDALGPKPAPARLPACFLATICERRRPLPLAVAECGDIGGTRSVLHLVLLLHDSPPKSRWAASSMLMSHASA